METGFDLNQEMRPWVSPSLIEANYILSLSRMELQALISAEMDANPALEIEERATCPNCGSLLEGTYCAVCRINHQADQQIESYEDFPEQMYTSGLARDDGDDFDPMTLVASEDSIRAQILADARTLLSPEEYPIAEYLIDSLDDRGFLACQLEEAAALLGHSLDELEEVLEVIQDVAPIGVGARDLRECLLLQLRFLTQSGHEAPPFVDEIIANHLAEFGAHKYGQIAKQLGVSPEEIEEARDYIRNCLNPFPLQGQQARSWQSPTQSPYVAPDVVISIKDDELHVDVVETKYARLRMNSLYEQLASTCSRHRSGRNGQRPEANGHVNQAETTEWAATASAEERTHVRHYSSRAKLFIANVQQRRETLLKISRCLCDLQESFLRGGVRELRPLTRAVVAQQVGVHESTVSRATANKYVMLPSRKVIPFSDFFTPSLSTKDVIKELIEHESAKGEPLTDRRICDLLLQQGIRIARRTVAKYRAELGILPSTMR